MVQTDIVQLPGQKAILLICVNPSAPKSPLTGLQPPPTLPHYMNVQ